MESSPRSATLPSDLRHAPPDLSASEEGSGFLAKLRRKFRFKKSGKYDVSLNIGESNNVSVISFQKNDVDLPSSTPPDSHSVSKGIKNRPERSYSDRGLDSSSRKRLKFNSKSQGVLHDKSPEMLSNGQEPLHSRNEKEFRNLIGGRIADSGNGNNYSPVFSNDSRKIGIKYNEIQSSGELSSHKKEEYKLVTVEDGIENNCIIPEESAVDLDRSSGLMSKNVFAEEPGYESLDDIRKRMTETQVKSDSYSQMPDQYSQTHTTESHWLKAKEWRTNAQHDISCPDMASSKGDRFSHVKPGKQVDTLETSHHFYSKTSKSVSDYAQPDEVLGKAFETTGCNTDKSAVIIVSDVDEDNAFGQLSDKAQGSECNSSPNVTSLSSTSFYSVDLYEMNFEDKLEEIDPGYASYSDIKKSFAEGASSRVAVNTNQDGIPPNAGESTLNEDHAQININESDLYANPQVLIRKRSQKVHLPKTELQTSLIDDVDLEKDLSANMKSKLKLQDMGDSSKPDHNEEGATEPPPLPARNYSLYIEKSEQVDVGRGASSNVESLELNTDSARIGETSTQNISEPCKHLMKKTSLENDKLIMESVLPIDQNILHYEGNFSVQCDNMHADQKSETKESKPSENDVTYTILPDSESKSNSKSNLEKETERENSPLPYTLIQTKSSRHCSNHLKISSYEVIDIPGMSAKMDFDGNDKCDESDKVCLIADKGELRSFQHINEQTEQQTAVVESLTTDLGTSNLNDEATDSRCEKISLQISDDDSDETDNEPPIRYFVRRYHPYESIDDIKAEQHIASKQDHHSLKSLDFSNTSSDIEKLDTTDLHKNKEDNLGTATCTENPLLENPDQTELKHSDSQTEVFLAVHERDCNDSEVVIKNEYTDENNELENIEPSENIEVAHHSDPIGTTGVTHAAEEILHSIHSFEELYGQKDEEASLSDIVTFDAAYDRFRYMYDDNEPTHMTMEEVFARARRSQSPCKLGETTQATGSSQKKELDSISPCPSYQTDASGIQFYNRVSDDWTNLDSAVYDDASDPSPTDGSQNRTNNGSQSEEAVSSPPPVPEHPPPPAVPPRARKHAEPSRPVSGIHQEFMESMQQLKNCGWYWGPLSWEEAEAKLMNKPEGSFLVRDSSDERYILSLSFKSRGHVHHTRIEHHKGRFSFWSQPESHGKSTIKDFVEQCMVNSSNGRFLYFIRPSGPGAPPLPIQLIYPVSRFAQMSSLQHMCRFRILQIVRRDHVDQLPIPTRIKEYLREAQYYVESLED